MTIRLALLGDSIAAGAGAARADGDGTTSRAFAADPTPFSSDRFHPSSTGYAVIAEALLPKVYAAAARLRETAAAPQTAPTQRRTT